MRKFSDWLGGKLAYGLSTMECFYLITILVMLPLIWQRPNGVVPWMQYCISVFFQGVALPVLGYVSRKAGESSEKITLETHDTVMAEMAMIKEYLVMAKEEREIQKDMMEDLHHLMNDMHSKTVN